MKKIVFIAILFLSCQGAFAQKSNLSKDEIKEYSSQIRVMVKYLEETFSFIGNPETSAQEKDIVFKESYAKIFKDEDVQIEEDMQDKQRESDPEGEETQVPEAEAEAEAAEPRFKAATQRSMPFGRSSGSMLLRSVQEVYCATRCSRRLRRNSRVQFFTA